MLTTIGLSIICVAWIYQFYLLLNKENKTISILFVGIYTAGVLSLVIDGFISGVSSVTWFNLVSFIISLGVFILLLKKK